MKYKNVILFIICSLIWGTTWLVIKFQIDSTSAIVGVFYRFFLAAILMFAFNFLVTKKNIVYPLKNHIYFALQGIFNFSINYILTYIAESKMSSGLVALTFTTLVYFNMIGLRLWFKKLISRNVFVGGIFGATGIALLFWKDLTMFNPDSKIIVGVIIGIIATFFASTGNMFAFKNHQFKIPVIIFNSYGMFYGAICTLMIGLYRHENFSFPTTPSFIISLLYLTVFGTVIAFWAYQTLVGTIGADRAAYTSIIAPVIAVFVSSVYENVQFTPLLIIGILFCIIGNIISLKKDSVHCKKRSLPIN